jgi:Mg2+/Co2+ transporter CorB
LDDSTPTSLLFGILVLLLLLSAFFSSSETALMTLNRYRLRHKARAGHRGARIADTLLRRPDKLIGLILLGNNLVNILAASLTTVISMRIAGESGIAAGALILTVVLLIFAEVTPKTFAALHPERIAFPSAYIYYPLLKVLGPLIWLLNGVTHLILYMFGLSARKAANDALSREELRTVVAEAGSLIPRKHQRMLLSILDLENITVDDVMVPRSDIQGLDLNDDWDEILRQVQTSQHTRVPLYRDSLDNIIGILHLRKVIGDLAHQRLTPEALEQAARDPYFVPEGTPLNTQLLNFQRQNRRFGVVVDEYGDIQGLVTLADILQEIVGEFTSAPGNVNPDVHTEADGTFVVSGSANLRDLNRTMNWDLPTDGPKTLNGLVVETLGDIPEPGITLNIRQYGMTILQTAENTVRTVRIRLLVPD